MLSRALRRLPLRRALHTAPPSPRTSIPRVALGAFALTAACTAWSLTREQNHIALDAREPATSTPSPPTPPAPEHLSEPPEPSEQPQSSSDPEDTPKSSGGGAYDPVTGEINWDCPCLGGMAHGPCGPEFREAFSCFVNSDDEPKGINCVEKFQAMQNCFRAHPEVYAEELMNDDDDEDDYPQPAQPASEPTSETGTLQPTAYKGDDIAAESSTTPSAPGSDDKPQKPRLHSAPDS